MKACHPIFFALFALAAGEALSPNAVPVMCAAICGPIVELSSMCSPKRSLGGLENDRSDLREHLRQAKRQNGKQLDERDEIEKRFSIIVPAPTSFPSDLLVDQYPPTSILPSQSSAPVPPQYYSPPVQPPPAPAPTLPTTPNYLPSSTILPASQSPSTSTTWRIQPSFTSAAIKTGKSLPTTSKQQTSLRPTIIGSTGDDGDMTGGWGETENAEEKCVCLNTSFNVAEIAGLCASCISMIADTQNDMEVIMSVCDFPPQQYSPDKDSLASNIWVKAARPTATSKSNGASQPTGSVSMGSMFGAVSFAIAALMML
ncbi:uncharacterized protein TRIVIDRAFT_217577 [Trichoderma virens Gv29-8]|uniref:Hydrophobin n=1 Tax=Hypocrea virens (strain Gv29-8 / FGSC 10586) TaxID=413071 RepID=G9MF03_HYPVG|nr:uncharacterized protein TRIVIDRAFT_217577 [Trichoderma virens Gv29-8]EHK26970.1 hypothetical protein TRIVIDRAFT_217577 [Trichoderma virens Gv29-8]UKZ57422.1 hypothetical protein TrVGV298_011279 [Trichoderma virens]